MASNRIPICFECKNANYDTGLDLYDIRCSIDGKIHDENGSCDKFEYNPNHSKINPGILLSLGRF